MTAEELKDQVPLAALGRLSKREEEELEAALADNPQLAAELREHEDIITGLWHSAAPLQTMPRSAWDEMQGRLHSEKPKTVTFLTKSRGWLAASGWAAAVALGLILFFQKTPSTDSAKKIKHSAAENQQIIDHRDRVRTAQEIVIIEKRGRDRLRKIQRQLSEALANRDSATLSSQIIELYRPGESVTSDPETRSRRLLKLLTQALSSDLRKLDEEAVALIIEDGWLDLALQNLGEDAVIRHRTFPVEKFADLNLLRSEEGYFYDQVSKFLWKPAEDGGGYLGSLAPEDLDLSQFTGPSEEPSLDAQSSSDTRLVELEPARGYLVRDAQGGSPAFVLNGIDSVLDVITIRQGERIAYLESSLGYTIPNSGIVTAGNRSGDFAVSNSGGIRTSSDSLGSPTPVFRTPPKGPQLLEVADSSGDEISWNEPFEVIRFDAFGNESVILTSEP